MNIRLTIVLSFLMSASSWALSASQVKEGDVILQRSTTRQSQAIADATHSQYTHVGVIIFRSGKPYVFEARQGVTFRSLSAFLSTGYQGKYVLRRVRGGLSANALTKLKAQVARFQGKPYDIYFGWADDKIYCSELVWKMYDRALGINVGRLQQLRDFDLTSPIVRQIMRERYGNNIPYGETVIAPSALAEASSLETVASNWF